MTRYVLFVLYEPQEEHFWAITWKATSVFSPQSLHSICTFVSLYSSGIGVASISLSIASHRKLISLTLFEQSGQVFALRTISMLADRVSWLFILR